MRSEKPPVNTVGFIGGGNMGFAMAKAISSCFPEILITVYDIRRERMERFDEEIPHVHTVSSTKLGSVESEKGPGIVVKMSDVVIIAVKPQDLQSLLELIKGTEELVISIVAGVPLKKLEEMLPKARMVRVMPNTPCLVGSMAAGYTLGSRVQPGDGAVVSKILKAAGFAVKVEEPMLDAVTGLSGSGPAFVARLIEAFIQAGVGLGLETHAAKDLAIQTFLGTAKLLAETNMEPLELVEMVSSPNGTTVAGREILENSDCREVIINTIKTAADRSRELGKTS